MRISHLSSDRGTRRDPCYKDGDETWYMEPVEDIFIQKGRTRLERYSAFRTFQFHRDHD